MVDIRMMIYHIHSRRYYQGTPGFSVQTFFDGSKMNLPGGKRKKSLSVQTLPQGSGSKPRQVFPVACQLARNTLDPQRLRTVQTSGPWSPHVPPQIKPLFFPQQGRLLYFGLSLDGIILSSYCCILKTNANSKLLRLWGCRARVSCGWPCDVSNHFQHASF